MNELVQGILALVAAKLRDWAGDACDDSARAALIQAAKKLERGA